MRRLTAPALGALFALLSLGSQCSHADEIPSTAAAVCGACRTVNDCAQGGVEVHCIAGRCQIACARDDECAPATCDNGHCACAAHDGGAD